MYALDIKRKLGEFTQIPLERIDDNALISDLVSDSFMLVETMLLMQDEFNIDLEQEDLEEVETVMELINLIEGKVAAMQPL